MPKRLLICILLSILPTLIYATVTDYLILQDIGPYKLFTTVFPEDYKGGQLPKYSQTNTGGILQAAGHFSENDVSYEASYTEPSSKWPFVKVEVTQHSGSDSDKWLLHEVEKSFRDSDDEEGRLGLLHKGSRLVAISNSKVFRYWSTYRWISNNVVVVIDYNDPRKPEPLEVVQAYIQKFPSTIPAAYVLDQTHDIAWIKDEMDRRLWLCDKWFMQLQLKKVDEKQTFQEAVKNMKVFLDYRGKYYNVKDADDKNLLEGYLVQNNGTGIKAKLTEYKNWWGLNKDKPISL